MRPLNSTGIQAKDILVTLLVTTAYLLLAVLLVGFKPEQLILAVLFNGCYYASVKSRKLILGFSIFIVYWIIFDFMKALPNYRVNAVHIESLYHLEKSLFGIHSPLGVVTPNEFWLQHKTTLCNILAGLFYLSWVPVPLAFAAYLFYTNRRLFLHFSLTFFLVNIIGFLIYYIYPAAPPWYVQQHGFEFAAGTPGFTAGLQQFDDFFGVSIFKGLYAKSSNVFAAMPSLHSAYPLIVLYYGLKARVGKMNILFAIIMLGIWNAAVYTSHHYVLDVLAGVLCASTAILLLQSLLSRSDTFNRWVNSFFKKIH